MVNASVQSSSYNVLPPSEPLLPSISEAVVEGADSLRRDFPVQGEIAEYWINRNVSQVHPPAALSAEKISEHRKRNFLRRISDGDWNAILQKIEGLNHSISSEELDAFRLGMWEHPVFDHADWIYFAFQAYLEDLIAPDTMCKLFLYNSCQRQVVLDEAKESDILEMLEGKSGSFSVFNRSSSFETCQVFTANGEVDPRSLDHLKEATKQYLDEREFRDFLSALSELPPEQTQFFIIEREPDSAFDAIRENVEWPLFITCSSNPEDSWLSVWQTVAPPEFIYRMHRARFGENAIRPAPALGYSEIENLSNLTSRIVSIPSFVPLPEKLHNLSAQPLTFYHHDIVYHHAIESANMHRPVWIAFAKFLKEREENWIFRTTLDRELLNYLEERKEVSSDNFWIGLPYHSETAIATMRTERHISKEREREYVNRFVFLFAEFYFKNQAELEERHGLSIESLQQCLLRRVKDPLVSLADFRFLQALYTFLEERSHND